MQRGLARFSETVKRQSLFPGEFYFCSHGKDMCFGTPVTMPISCVVVNRYYRFTAIIGVIAAFDLRPARNDDEWVSLNGGREKRSALGITKAGELRSNANCNSQRQRQRRRLIDRLSVNSEVKTGRSLKRSLSGVVRVGQQETYISLLSGVNYFNGRRS